MKTRQGLFLLKVLFGICNFHTQNDLWKKLTNWSTQLTVNPSLWLQYHLQMTFHPLSPEYQQGHQDAAIFEGHENRVLPIQGQVEQSKLQFTAENT